MCMYIVYTRGGVVEVEIWKKIVICETNVIIVRKSIEKRSFNQHLLMVIKCCNFKNACITSISKLKNINWNCYFSLRVRTWDPRWLSTSPRASELHAKLSVHFSSCGVLSSAIQNIYTCVVNWSGARKEIEKKAFLWRETLYRL